MGAPLMLRLAEPLAEAIRRAGEAGYPAECCGVIAGVPGPPKVAERLVPIPNARGDDPHRYLIDAERVRRVDAELRAEGLEILGFYHSHPDHPPVPSAFDTAHAWPWYSYVIVAVRRGEAAELAAWVLDDEAPVMRPEELLMTSEV